MIRFAKPLALVAVFVSMTFAGCKSAQTVDESEVLDVPSIAGSVAEYTVQRWPYQGDLAVAHRVAVMADGQVAFFSKQGDGQLRFDKYVASYGTGMVNNIRSISAEALLPVVDRVEQLVEPRSAATGPIGISGQ